MYDCQEDLDELVWDQNDEDAAEAQKLMRRSDTCRRVAALVKEKFGQETKFISPIIMGGFNILYRICVDNRTPDVIVRLPAPALVQFPEEKTMQEAATAILVAEKTTLPTPKYLYHGNDAKLGPFIIMNCIEHGGSMSKRLTMPSSDPDKPHLLDPRIDLSGLQKIWSKAAHGLIQLSQLTFSRIGSLVQDADGTIDVRGRPITHNMTDMIRLANIPQAVLPSEGTTYSSADDWYTALSEMHIAQLAFQHNDAIASADDCRNKYVARQVFRRLAKTGKLSTFGFQDDTWSAQASRMTSSLRCSAPPTSDGFRLWGDDFRAGNILLQDTEEGDVAGFIDWECTYAAPTTFVLDPPWWLLLETAEMWQWGAGNFAEIYSDRLPVWLAAMEQAEREAGEYTALPLPLSVYMRESWETGRFFVSYAARKSWAFDMVYWRFLDERFFGAREDSIEQDDLWKTRIDLLGEDEKAAMEPFVARKMAEMEDRRIVNGEAEDAKRVMAGLLFD